MKKKNTNLILTISILLFIFLSGSCGYVFSVIKNKNKHISAVENTLENKIKEKENMDVLEKKMIELGDTHKRIGSYLVDTSSIDTFVEYLEKLGVEHDVALLVKGVEVPKNDKNKLSININMKGSFSNVTKIINLVENAPYNITISSLYLNKEVSQVETSNQTNKNKEFLAQTKSYWQADVIFSVLSL